MVETKSIEINLRKKEVRQCVVKWAEKQKRKIFNIFKQILETYLN